MPITFPFYNANVPPSSATKNNINDISGTVNDSGIRDFLLKKNIGGSSTPPTSFYNLSTTPAGGKRIGEPITDTSVNGDVNQSPDYSPIQQYGIIWKDNNNINNNQFQNTSTTADDLIDIPNATPKSLGGIIDNGVTTFNFGNTYFPLVGSILSYPNKPNSPLIDSYGILAKTTFAQFLNSANFDNIYFNTESQVDVANGIDSDIVKSAYLSSHAGVKSGEAYLDTYGKLNLGQSGAIAAADILGSVLNGQGVGLSTGGVVSNFDVRSSLVGRALTAGGIINDTNLGYIGGQQLAMALANNAAFNVQQEILGKLNLQDNVIGLLKGNGLSGLRPNYQITVPSSGVGKFFNGAAKILGFTLPRSFIGVDGSIFASENGGIENVKRANALLINTGKGQFVSLIKNVKSSIGGTTEYDIPTESPFRSGYAPSYAVGNTESPIDGDNIYAYSDGKGHLINILGYSSDNSGKPSVIPDLSFKRKPGFETFQGQYSDGSHGNNIKYISKTWTSVSGGTTNLVSNPPSNYFNSYNPTERKNILTKTQKLFDSSNMRTIVSSKGILNEDPSQIQTTNGNGISKGSAVLKKEFFTKNGEEQNINSSGDSSNVFARAWTTFDRYDKVSKLIRHSGLYDEKQVPYRNQYQGSVLDDNGFAKIAPYINEVDDPKKYMFSIENLAWNDQYYNLLPCERGTGDLLTGKKGRIMWFPPYDIQFSESNSVEWDSNKFIGRGESVYTYSNTERSGTLSFKVVVDHPTYVNTFASNRVGNQHSPTDNYVASFFAGEIPPDEIFSNKLTSYELDVILNQYAPAEGEKQTLNNNKPTEELTLYFPNDVYTYYTDYEVNGTQDNPSAGLGYVAGQVTSKRNYNDNANFGLNKQWVFKGNTYTDFLSLLNGIGDFMLKKENAPYIINVTGYASKPGENPANDALASKRADTVITMLKNVLTGKSVENVDKRVRKIKNVKEVVTPGCTVSEAGYHDQTSIECKVGRKIDMTFDVDYNLIADKTKLTVKKTVTPTTFKNPFYGECSFFEKLKETDSFIFDKFRDKIKYFHPAFHSTTPEGLNSRLTFLLQCTRQGPTLEQEGANNLAFGRPPVCILRIGDFYNTKIIIDNISFDYEPLVWDLNPEGIGVQPMIANVQMSFKFIGGSTLLGPINKLQNALSFNYFANTQVYDVRADYLSKVKNPEASKAPNSDYELKNAAMDTLTGKDKKLIKGDLNKGVYTIEGESKPLDEQLQTKMNDKATDGKEEEKPKVETYKIRDFNATFNKKIENFFMIEILIKISEEIPAYVINDPDAGPINVPSSYQYVDINQTILDEIYNPDNTGEVSYKISLKDINTSEIYEEDLTKEEFAAYTKADGSNFFKVPIKPEKNSKIVVSSSTIEDPELGTITLPAYNSDMPGIFDSLGKETFEISLVKVTKTENEKVKKQNIKLK